MTVGQGLTSLPVRRSDGRSEEGTTVEHETAQRYRSTTATYVQAWQCTSEAHRPPHPHCGMGYVYAQSIAVQRLEDGHNVVSVTIIRNDDGTRETLPGTVAREVFAARAGMTVQEGIARAESYRQGWLAAVEANR